MNVAIHTCADQVPTQTVSEVMEHTISVFLRYKNLEKQSQHAHQGCIYQKYIKYSSCELLLQF